MDPKNRVLDLVESGKISADEAAKLIQALGGGPKFISKEQKENIEEKLHTFAQDVTRVAKDVGGKVHIMYKDVEPKIKKASQTTLEKVAGALDSLAKSINESLEKAAKEEESCGCCCGDDEDDKPRPN
jgi:polyhydroxyalkanoate synthesis regulator phasin